MSSDTLPKRVLRSYIEAQPGPQSEFLANEADIIIYGGQAGGGKTVGLLLSALQWAHVPRFGAVIFRRISKQVTDPGGLWDTAAEIFSLVRATGSVANLEWTFKSGATCTFDHLQHENSKTNWMGSQICMIGFDELTHFTETQFFYLMSRNRSTCGVRPFIRATCNPIPDDDPVGGWVHRLLQWWIDPDTGKAIEERAGVIRWMVRRNNELFFADSRQELFEKFKDQSLPDDHESQPDPKSLTFIPAKLSDNPLMREKDPGYRGSLEMLLQHDKEALLEGNWNARPTGGKFYKTGLIKIVDALPASLRMCRAWDLAYTEGDGDWTVGIKLGVDLQGYYYIMDRIRGQWEASYRDAQIRQAAQLDGRRCMIRIPQDPGAGKAEAERLVRELAGYQAIKETVHRDKPTRAAGAAAQMNAGNFRMLRAAWNASLISLLNQFPSKGIPDDDSDALADAFNALTQYRMDGIISAGTGGTKAGPDHPYRSLVDKEK